MHIGRNCDFTTNCISDYSVNIPHAKMTNPTVPLRITNQLLCSKTVTICIFCKVHSLNSEQLYKYLLQFLRNNQHCHCNQVDYQIQISILKLWMEAQSTLHGLELRQLKIKSPNMPISLCFHLN